MLITLKNHIHNTTANVRPTKAGRLNDRQVKAAYRALCGQSDCQCQKVTSAANEQGRKFYFTQSPNGADLTAF